MWDSLWRNKFGLAASSVELTGLALSWTTDFTGLAIAYVVTGLTVNLVFHSDGRLRRWWRG